MSRKNIEGIDGGFIQYDSQDEDEADALNADTFGDDALDGFEPSSQGFFDSMRPDGNRLNPPPGLGRPVQSGSRQRQERPTPPPGLTRPSPPPEVLRRPSPPTIGLYLVEHISPPPPPPPPGPEAPPLLSSVSVPPPPPPPPEASNALTGRPSVPQMSIHVVPVRVFPTPFTARQKAQALAGQLDVNKWGRQEEFVRDHELMTFRDREFVTKIQLNQMVALSGSQNHRGQFTFARSSGAPAAISQSQKDKSSSLGKRLYASVYHPRKLVSFENMTSGSDESVKSDKSRQIAEDVFDLLIDVSEIDEYISTLHPLAEDKINEAILERTEILERATNTLVGYTGSKQGKLGVAQKNVIDKLVELLQPAVTDNEAHARRSLIFRRVPEAVQGFYIDLLEKIVQQ